MNVNLRASPVDAEPPVSLRSARLERLIDALGDVPVVTEPARVKKKSLDFYWYSPVLKPRLADKTAELIAIPRNEADVVRIAAACAKFRLPLTVRGAGTGNYGQAVPLEGGVVVDMIDMDRVLWTKSGLVRVEAGKLMLKLDRELRPYGWEQRMFPSTKRTATIGGFVAGGSGGIGSVTYGGLRERGNVVAARVVTCEETPRVIELRGDRTDAVNHAYGTTGIITELEMPLTPALEWRDVVVAFKGFGAAARFGQALALADPIVKKLVTPIAWPIPSFFPQLGHQLPKERDIVICMVAAHSMQGLHDLVAGHSGEIVHDVDSLEAETNPARALPLYEYTWNHTTLHALKVDRAWTYLQCLYPAGRNLEMVEHMIATFPDELLMHMEMIRFGGRLTNSGLPLVRFTTEERLGEIIACHEAHGVRIANPHVWTLEDGSAYKTPPEDQCAFKAGVDPYGLLNPGKMRTYRPKMG
jgi:FAD/FMN-containing dehydrogenase